MVIIDGGKWYSTAATSITKAHVYVLMLMVNFWRWDNNVTKPWEYIYTH